MSDSLSRRATIGLMATIASGALLHQQSQQATAATPSTPFTFTASNGSSSECRFYSAGAAKAGLVVYLDGDGQQLHDQDHDGDNPNFPGGLAGPGSIVEAALARNHDVLSVHTPSADGTWWHSDHNAKITYLNELLQHVRTTYGANIAALWLVGYSGGSEFITRYFFPHRANDIETGGFLVFGGGDAPGPEWTGSFSQYAKSNLSLNLVTGESDRTADYDALGGAQETAAFYRSAGFEHVWSHWPQEHDHLTITHEFGTYLGTVIDAYDEE